MNEIIKYLLFRKGFAIKSIKNNETILEKGGVVVKVYEN